MQKKYYRARYAVTITTITSLAHMSFFLRIKIGSIENRRVCAR